MRSGKEPRINLLRYRQEELSDKRSNRIFKLVLALALVLCVGAMSGMWWTQNQKMELLQQENQELQQQVDQLAVEVSGDQELAPAPKDLSAREAMIRELAADPRISADNLREIYELSDLGITIGSMQVKAGESLTLAAYCNSQTKFIQFLDGLRTLDYVKEVQNVSSRLNDKTGEVNFNITLVWEVE